jgi:hypothetical protein
MVRLQSVEVCAGQRALSSILTRSVVYARISHVVVHDTMRRAIRPGRGLIMIPVASLTAIGKH